MKRPLLLLARLLGFFGFSSCALQPVPHGGVELARKVEQEELAVLFIGNSYSFGVPGAFAELARSRGKKVRIGHSTYGGWSLERHSQHPPTLKELREGKWDVVVLQEFSTNPALKERQRARVMDPAVRFFVKEARTLGAVPVLYQTWGRRDGDPSVAGDDFYQMNARVREGCRKASERAGGIPIAPVGDAWEEEYRAGRGQDLYVEDGSHSSAYGDKMTARVFYETIFRESASAAE